MAIHPFMVVIYIHWFYFRGFFNYEKNQFQIIMLELSIEFVIFYNIFFMRKKAIHEFISS